MDLWYPQKYFNINLFQHEHLAITIAHVLLISCMKTIVCEKFVVGNIYEKKICGKKFSSYQATNHYKLLYFFMVRKFLSYLAYNENFFMPNFSQTTVLAYSSQYAIYYTVIFFKLYCTVGHSSILWITCEVT